MAEQDLSQLGIFVTKDTEILQCIYYLNNLCYSDVIDTCKNVKFPGTLPVSLSREQLKSTLGGANGSHKPYLAQEIVSWMDPVERHIPPLILLPKDRGAHDKPLIINTVISVHDIDFGDKNGLFDILGPLNMNVAELDFGESDGLFLSRLSSTC